MIKTSVRVPSCKAFVQSICLETATYRVGVNTVTASLKTFLKSVPICLVDNLFLDPERLDQLFIDDIYDRIDSIYFDSTNLTKDINEAFCLYFAMFTSINTKRILLYSKINTYD